jgi:hypothetical protein
MIFREISTWGGRNWGHLYKNHDRKMLCHVESVMVEITKPVTGRSQQVQMVDRRWLHIGSISYNDNFSSKSLLYEHLALALDQGESWSAILAKN